MWFLRSPRKEKIFGDSLIALMCFRALQRFGRSKATLSLAKRKKQNKTKSNNSMLTMRNIFTNRHPGTKRTDGEGHELEAAPGKNKTKRQLSSSCASCCMLEVPRWSSPTSSLFTAGSSPSEAGQRRRRALERLDRLRKTKWVLPARKSRRKSIRSPVCSPQRAQAAQSGSPPQLVEVQLALSKSLFSRTAHTLSL